MTAPPIGQWGCVLADPPWYFRNHSEAGEGKNPVAHYDCMPLADIMALDMTFVGAANCALVMWATAPMLPEALQVISAWGFKFKTAGAWAKQSSTGTKWAFGTGYIFRSAAEFILVGTRGEPKVRSRSVRNLIVAPVREHSRKPAQTHDMCEALFDGPYLEMFAREPRPGWVCWGNETQKFSGQTNASHPIDDTGQLTSRGVALEVVTAPADQSDIAQDIALQRTEAVDAR